MEAKDILKINKILKIISVNFPNIKISPCFFGDGSVAFSLFRKVYHFKNTRDFVKNLAFLCDAKFSRAALETLEKKKISKRKNIFFYWLAICVDFGNNKSRTLEDLRREFNAKYSVKAGAQLKKAKTSAKSATASAGNTPTHATECTEQGQIL